MITCLKPLFVMTAGLFLGLSLSTHAGAQEASVSAVSDDYERVSNAWYMEQKCNLLPAKAHQELEWQVWRISEWVAKNDSVDFAIAVQTAARRAADNTDCADAGNVISKDTLALARSLNGHLDGETYSHPTANAQYNIRRFTRAALGVEVILEACDHFDLSEARWAEIKSSFTAAKAQLEAAGPQLMKEAEKLIAAQKAEFKPADCNARARQRANGAIYALDNLEKSLK